jgi:hypothetical protein
MWVFPDPFRKTMRFFFNPRNRSAINIHVQGFSKSPTSPSQEGHRTMSQSEIHLRQDKTRQATQTSRLNLFVPNAPPKNKLYPPLQTFWIHDFVHQTFRFTTTTTTPHDLNRPFGFKEHPHRSLFQKLSVQTRQTTHPPMGHFSCYF